ncbi:MAG: aminotransferase class V-fold PLP-dependent enzyme [Nitrospinae bacterium]|nr:aminotransferase class V-fold PLP-dependent enzyme [Nitrospinota bacterium]
MPASTPYQPAESSRIRAEFPMLENYIYFNSAGLAPIPVKTRDAIMGMAREVSVTAYLNMDEWKAKVAETRQLAARITGGTVEETAFIRNTSDGVSLVASGYPFREGDEVIINDLEFPSNVYPWLNLQRKGVNVKIVKSREGRVTVDDIAREVTSKTRFVAISTTQYSTGFRADLAGLGQLAREKGFLFFVDAIQSLGVLPMDVKGFGIDFLACGGHKWLCAPEGIGIFHCNRERLDTLELTRTGWHTVKDCYNFAHIDFTPHPTAERFEEGTMNIMGIYGLAESLKTVMMFGIQRNEAQALHLTGLIAEGARSKGYNVLSPMEDRERSSILIISHADPSQNARIVKRLNANRVLLMERGGGIRVAAHFFNTEEDVEKLVELL